MRRRPAVVAAALTVACTMVLALGDFPGDRGAACDRHPVALADRDQSCRCSTTSCRSALMVVAYLALAVIVAIFVDRVLEAPRWKRVGGLAVAAAALIPLIPRSRSSPASSMSPPSSPTVRHSGSPRRGRS